MSRTKDNPLVTDDPATFRAWTKTPRVAAVGNSLRAPLRYCRPPKAKALRFLFWASGTALRE